MTDYIKNYAQMSAEANRNLALHVDHTFEGLKEVVEDTAQSIQMGAKRALWRTSYFFDGYEDVNQQINHEDYRMILAINKVIKERDFIFKMARIYIDILLRDLDDKKAHGIIVKAFKFSSSFATSGAVKATISYSIATAISESFYLSPVIRKSIRSFSNIGITILKGYSYVEKAAMAANDLKRESPIYYWSLYKENLEMLYFIIEPMLSKTVYKLGKNNTPEDIVKIINSIVYQDREALDEKVNY